MAKTRKVNNVIGMGSNVAANESGITPKESQPMGDYYGTGFKAKIGQVRSDTVGYRPVSRKQMGTPPRSLV